jgi:putative sigma-54 modulation protein
MQLIITGKNTDVSDRMESYVRRKLGKLDRYLNDNGPVEARVELSTESARNVNQRQIAQVTVIKNGTIIRGEERAAELTAAIDAVVDKIERQIKRYKEKPVTKKRRAQAHELEAETAPVETTPSPIVRVKRFRTPPMSEEEAIEQMELLGHSFFIFLNQTSGMLNVLYRREDGNYGLLEPEFE